MTPKKYYTFMIDLELADALKRAKERDPESSEASIIRRALREWLEREGVIKADRKRVPARKRP
ncbi:MAG: hypothetical protein NTV05_05185 [Acidobacteria bacterium]|nr:hypothetical protein [Acidobacteriota bacterium]